MEFHSHTHGKEGMGGNNGNYPQQKEKTRETQTTAYNRHRGPTTSRQHKEKMEGRRERETHRDPTLTHRQHKTKQDMRRASMGPPEIREKAHPAIPKCPGSYQEIGGESLCQVAIVDQQVYRYHNFPAIWPASVLRHFSALWRLPVMWRFPAADFHRTVFSQVTKSRQDLLLSCAKRFAPTECTPQSTQTAFTSQWDCARSHCPFTLHLFFCDVEVVIAFRVRNLGFCPDIAKVRGEIWRGNMPGLTPETAWWEQLVRLCKYVSRRFQMHHRVMWTVSLALNFQTLPIRLLDLRWRTGMVKKKRMTTNAFHTHTRARERYRGIPWQRKSRRVEKDNPHEPLHGTDLRSGQRAADGALCEYCNVFCFVSPTPIRLVKFSESAALLTNATFGGQSLSLQFCL